MKKFFKDEENRICFYMFVITIVIAVIPLMSKYCINGHDLEYHLLRIESLKEGILIGKPFLKVNTIFFGGAGYASSMFYGDLFMYFPALLRVLGLSIGASYHIFVALVFVLCYMSTFFCAYRITNSKYAASMAAILLTLCPYHMDDMLVRAACGEYTAFIFIPFVVYGIYNVVFENMDSPWIFGIGFAGLILTHPATLFLNIIFCIAVMVIFIKKFIGNPKLIINLAVVTLITMAVTSFQWLPMIEQMMSTHFYVSEDSVDMLDAALSMTTVFSQTFPGVGVLLVILSFPRIFLSSKEHKELIFADVLLAGGIVYAVGASNIIPWSRLGHYLSFVQFPWRLFTMTSTLLAFADAIILIRFTEDILKGEKGRKESVLLVVLGMSALLALNHSAENETGYYDYGNDYYSYKPYTANVIGGEWLPLAVTDRDNLLILSEFAFADDGREIDFTRQKAAVQINVPDGCSYVDVPLVYYKGYYAGINDGGREYKLSVTGEGIDGLCRVYTQGLSGLVTVEYRGTAIQKAAYIVSMIFIVGLIGIKVYKGKKEKRTKNEKAH